MEEKIEEKKCVFKKIAFEFISLNTNFAEREYLSLGVNMLTNSLKIWDTTKKKLLELKFFQIDRKIWKNYTREDFSRVSDPLTCWLSISVPTQQFLGI